MRQVVNRFLRGRCRGSAVLTVTIATAAMISAIALSLVKMNSATDYTLQTNDIKNQAVYYAYAEADLARAVSYASLSNYYKKSGAIEQICEYDETTGSYDRFSGYSKKISLGNETVYRESSFSAENNVNMRKVNIKIYHEDYSYPLVNTDVPRYSREKNPYIPVGTIIGWVGTGTPSEEYGRWIECKERMGCLLYKELTKVLGRGGATEDFVPNLTGITFKGAATDTETGRTETLLPNIVGKFPMPNVFFGGWGGVESGALSYSSVTDVGTGIVLDASLNATTITMPNYWVFDASKSNSIYGGSDKFDFGNFAVKFLVKADDI